MRCARRVLAVMVFVPYVKLWPSSVAFSSHTGPLRVELLVCG